MICFAQEFVRIRKKQVAMICFKHYIDSCNKIIQFLFKNCLQHSHVVTNLRSTKAVKSKRLENILKNIGKMLKAF